MTRTATVLVLLTLSAIAAGSSLVRLDVGPTQRTAVIADALPVYKDIEASLILPLSPDQQAALHARGWQVQVLDPDLSPGEYFIIYKAGPGTGSTPGRLLWENDRLRLVRLPELDARAAKAAGFPIVQLPLIPHPLPAPLAPLPLSPYSADTTIARIVSLVSRDSLARTIHDLQDFGTRYSYRLKCESAAFYLRARLADLGYSARLDTYYLTSPNTRAFNVEATWTGQVQPESMVVACAHFDSYNDANQNDAPGADDNATGTAAVLELARVLKQTQFRWSVKFLCFSGEEQWMKGSYHWVDSTARPQNLRIAGVYNLDMFGYAAYDTNLVFVNTNTASRPLANLGDSTNNWYAIGLRVLNYLDEDIYGDNTPFWEAGYRSIFALEDSEYGIWNGSNPNYHTAGDTFGNLTMSLVTRTTQMTAACLATLAGPHNPVGVAERPGLVPRRASSLTVFAHALDLPGHDRVTLLDASGRIVETGAGPRFGGQLRPGVYFVRSEAGATLRRVVKVR